MLFLDQLRYDPKFSCIASTLNHLSFREMVVFSLNQQLDNGRIDRDVFGEELGNFLMLKIIYV